MKLRSKLFALMGAGALVLGVAGAALATSSPVNWTFNGTHLDGDNRVLDTVDCDVSDGQPYLYWVLSPSDGISDAHLWINGNDQGAGTAASDNGNAAIKWTTDWFDLNSLTASATFTGEGGNGLKLKISHGCAGTESTPPSEGPSFGGSVGDITDAPTEPNTATIGTSNGGPTDSSWLFIAAIGVLLASVVVMTPARAKSKR